MTGSNPPNLVAAMTACVDLLEAFNPEHSAATRRHMIFRAIESAIEATGAPKEKRKRATAALHFLNEESSLKRERRKASSLRIV